MGENPVTGRPLVVIPTYNEAGNILGLLEEVLSLPEAFDVLVVDDASPDATASLVKEARQKQNKNGDHIHLIERPEKLGLGSAYCEGFRWALERNYSIICQMDADFSHAPSDLSRLVKELESFDLVLGTRYMPDGGTIGWSWYRRVLSRGASIFAKVLTGVPVRDLTGGFKGYRKEALLVLDLSRIRSAGYTFQIETTAYVHRKKFRIKEIPILFRERVSGKSKISSVRTIVQTVWLVLRLFAERIKPVG